MPLDLATHGDHYEQVAYPLFVKNNFPAYESFWQNFIVPLTNRPTDVYTKSDQDLAAQFPNETIDQIHEKIAVLQLHYSVLRMLLKAHEKRALAKTNIDAVEACFSHLFSALDIAAELLGKYERIRNNAVITTSAFEPLTSERNSITVRKAWQRSHAYPQQIKDIRKYRNLMLHGQMFGAMATSAANYLILPKPEAIEKYLDWRQVGQSFHSQTNNNLIDFLHSVNIVNPAVEEVTAFLNTEWNVHLL